MPTRSSSSIREAQIKKYIIHQRIQSKERIETGLAVLVGDTHDLWPEKLLSICFALNSSTTGHIAAYLQFGCKLRTLDDVVPDLKAVLDNDNCILEIMPYLRRLAMISKRLLRDQ
ncbi:reverse transcriptase [Caerostris extrusa]|uniref:Reverse transcriptase n=1 Tax=Caerostris extrusa TaxID=172846 RepID=A0AAV4QRS9_CAEEX|nr:reverse transcriptase [Caerostris extrusa]